MTIKLTNDKAALVDTTVHWIPVEGQPEPPRGAKLLLINRRYGVAVIGHYNTNSQWTHWAPLPTFAD